MAYELIIEPEAELELEQAVNWYNEQRPGLGREFIERVDEVLDRIREMPEVYSVNLSGHNADVTRLRDTFCFLDSRQNLRHRRF